MKSVLLSIVVCLILCITISCIKRNNKNPDSDFIEKIVITNKPASVRSATLFDNFLGINAFEWNFHGHDNSFVSPHRLQLIKSFKNFRHYMDWEKIEPVEGRYTFNPTSSGSWRYDIIYESCKENNIEVIACLKTCPPWLVNTYPAKIRDVENVPAPYGLKRSSPASYIKQAKTAFQFAARYGYNTKIDSSMLSVYKVSRWPGDLPNRVKIGLGFVKYIECDNERDKWWKGKQAEQSPEEYAANMSAFYDGHMGKLGKNVGVKNADPAMQVVMGGLSKPDPNYVIAMIAWCKKNRGVKSNGEVNLCFDVINYHYYSENVTAKNPIRTAGGAPELGLAAKIADSFVNMSKRYAGNKPVWVTECGYDVNPKSPQAATIVGNKSILITQADWSIRTSLLYARHGIKKVFFYMLEDVDKKNPTQYSSSGFIDSNEKRPAAFYFSQVKKLLGAYSYSHTVSANPIIDVYSLNKKYMYVAYIPNQKNLKSKVNLKFKGFKYARIYQLVPESDTMLSKLVHVINDQITLNVTETPTFAEGTNDSES